MTARPYGPHGDLVEQFLVDVRRRDTDWSALAVAADRPEQRPAVRALSGVRWPAARLAAVDSDATKAYGELGLSRESFDDPFVLGTVKVAITAGAKAVAVHDDLAPEHVEALLRPFAEAGYGSASAVLASVTAAPGTDAKDR